VDGFFIEINNDTSQNPFLLT